MNILKTFFITGISTGFGRALAEAALADGHRVVGTLRNEAARAEFEAQKPGFSFGKLLDATDTAVIAASRMISTPSTSWSTMPATVMRASSRNLRSRIFAANST